MTELEEVAEGARDAVLEEVEHPVKKQPGWVAWLAISTMVMALFCAVGALMAGITANEAVMERTHEIMEVVNRDRDQIEIEILRSKHDVLKALGVAADENERKIVEKSRDVGKLTEEIKEEEATVGRTLRAHEIFAIGVTLLSIAIVLNGMAAVLQRRHIWHIALGLATVGGIVVIYAATLTVLSS